MEIYLSILLMVAPGFISVLFNEKLTSQGKKQTDFQLTVKSLIFSAFDFVLSYAFLNLLFPSLSFNALTTKLATPWFAIMYAGIVLTASLLVALAWSLCFRKLLRVFVNIVRAKCLDGLKVTKHSVIFNDIFMNAEIQVVRIEKGGRILMYGCLDRFSGATEGNLEITLSASGEWESFLKSHPETKESHSYYDSERDLKIVVYDISSLEVVAVQVA